MYLKIFITRATDEYGRRLSKTPEMLRTNVVSILDPEIYWISTDFDESFLL